jgi:phosphatidylserine/phosphatidylglycerophosphate/cardiolipin synthase-like enzyme
VPVRASLLSGRRRAAVAVMVGFALVPGAAAAATPHMDRVEAAMRKVAPELEGIAYQRTRHNKLVGYNGRRDSWLLQTPDCWGQRACRNPVGIRRFLRTLEHDLAKARRVVDLTTFMPFPFGEFQDAIVRGLRRAYAAGRRPTIRVLGGCAPPCQVAVGASPAQTYADQLSTAIGGNPAVVVGAYRFPAVATPPELPSLSWNHSKTITVDGRVTLVGGHNLWGADYIQGYPQRPVTNPVHDVTVRVEGPLTVAVHRWANALWRRACASARVTAAGAANGASVAFGAGTPRVCPGRIRPPRAARRGGVDVLGFGRFALLGVEAGNPGSGRAGGPDDPAPCPTGLPYWAPGRESPDWTNDRALYPRWDPRNPAERGLRALIASARSSVFIAQQDLHGLCHPPSPGITPRFDRRLLDTIARRLLAGVDVRVVISTPGAAVSEAETYSNTTSLSQTSGAILARTRALAPNPTRAGRAVRNHFRLAAIRFSDSPTWPNAPPPFNKIANHSKLGMIDNCAIWVGSHNLYPFWLADYSLLIESRRAARSFKRDYADPLWRYSARRGPIPGRPCPPRR